jgi:Holliday junction resolvase-like predicted endonuclease
MRALLAGHFAEVKYRRQQGMSAATSVSWASDRRHAETLASYLNGSTDQTDAYLRWLLVGAQQRVEVQWRVIRALAIQLSKLRTISGPDAYQMMLRASIGH